jgi:hypothetical protein
MCLQHSLCKVYLDAYFCTEQAKGRVGADALGDQEHCGCVFNHPLPHNTAGKITNSGTCDGGKYEVIIVSKAFEGKPLLARHRYGLVVV